MYRHIRAAVVTLAVLLACGSPAPLRAQQAAPPSEEQIRELLRITQSDQMMDQMLTGLSGQMQQAFEPAFATMPEKDRPAAQKLMEAFWTKFVESAKSDSDAFMQDIIKIYKERLTSEEVKASIDFYKTPTGQSLMKKMPEIMMESFQVGRVWGQQKGAAVMKGLIEELQREFPDFGKAPRQAPAAEGSHH